MNEGKDREDQAIDAHTNDAGRREKAKETYAYRWSGIFERHGYVPRWLIIAWLLVVVWSLFYLWSYWSPPEP